MPNCRGSRLGALRCSGFPEIIVLAIIRDDDLGIWLSQRDPPMIRGISLREREGSSNQEQNDETLPFEAILSRCMRFALQDHQRSEA